MSTSTLTIADAINRHGVDVLDHLDRTATIPVLTGLQMQGDLAVVPMVRAGHTTATTPVPVGGVPVVRGENGGHTHTLLAEGDVRWDTREANASSLTLGVLTVGDGATAYLAHPEHAYSGIGPGCYEIRRQREIADELRLVAD